MRCDIYNATIPASLCLEYQDRAVGKYHPKYSNQARRECWDSKYKPCLTCEMGQKVKANGGKDMDRDIETLKAARSLSQSPDGAIGQICKVCGVLKNFSEFYEVVAGSKRYIKECKTCTKKRVAEQATAKRQAKLASRDIDQNAPNIASKVDIDAMETQSISENCNEINDNDIDQMETNSAKGCNSSVDIPAPISNDKGEVVAWTDSVFVCRKCGEHYTSEDWVNLETIDSSTRMCEVCDGVVSMLVGNGDELPQTEIIHRTCTRCGYVGPEKDFHVAGNSGFINVCRKCVSIERVKNKKLKAARTVELPDAAIILDFSEYPELLEKITADAKKSFRTVSNEILFRVVSYGKY